MLHLGDMNIAAWVFIGAAFLTSALLMLRTSRYLSKQRRMPPPSVTPQPASGARAIEPGGPRPVEVERWEVAMHDKARDLTAELDSKMGALQQLIREADRAAARLERALAAAGSTPAEPMPAAAEPPSAAIDSPRGEPAAVPPPMRASDATKGNAKARPYEEIYLLADYGYPAAEIAQRLGMPVGEIELIVSLRQRAAK